MTSRRLPILSCFLLGLFLSMSALPLSYYTSQSRLATGRWVKIATSTEQMYQLSYDKLRELGFEHPERVQVFGYPTTDFNDIAHTFSDKYTDDIAPIATCHTADGRIIFFGGADNNVTASRCTGTVNNIVIRRSYYDTASHYFLTEVDEVMPVATYPQATVQAAYQVADYHVHVDLLEEELQSYNQGGCSMHGQKYKIGDTVPFTFYIKNYKTGTESSSAYGSFFYRFAVNSTGQLNISPAQAAGLSTPASIGLSTVNASPITATQIDIAYNDSYGTMPFQGANGGDVPDGEYTFNVTIGGSASSVKYCAADHAILRYPRANRLDDNTPSLIMNLSANATRPGQRISFENAPEGSLEVWNIDNSMAYEALPVSFDASDNTARVVLRDNTSRLVAFNPSATLPEPEIVGELPVQNLHGLSTPQMLIITTAELEPLAQRVADAHRRHGLDAMVVRHDLIYNEFSSGSRHPMAYRRMAKMFYDRDPQRFRYLMFFGPAHYDARSLILPEADRMVCYMQDDPQFIRSLIFNYATDNYFAMLSDDYEHSLIANYDFDIAVGRVSAINGAQASIYVDKVEKYLDNSVSPDVYSRALLLSGHGDKAMHGQHSKQVLEAMKADNSNLNFVVVPEELYPESTPDLHVRLISQALKDGCGYMTYSGHGAINLVSMWNTAAVNATRYEHPTFAMFSSCDQFAFDRMHNSLLEVMMFQVGGGAIGGVGADRSVYINYNQLSCLPMARAYAQAKPGDTFGDLYLNARKLGLQKYIDDKLTSSSTPLRNMMSYNLAGDPALPVCVPAMNATIDRIGEYAVADAPALKPFTPTTLSGSITDSDGNIIDDFNGTVSIALYDGTHTAATAPYAGETDLDKYKPEIFPIDSDILTTAQAKVSDGRFTAEISCPLPAYVTDTYRLTISAMDTDGNGASGALTGLRIADFDISDPDMADTPAPQILSMNVGDSEYRPGIETAPSATISAVIDPSKSGLSFQNGNVNSRTRLTIDANTHINNLESALTRRPDGCFDLSVQVNDLIDGVHTATLQVSNNAGLIDRYTVEFTVATRAIDVVLGIDEEPARTQATFHAISSASFERLTITDSQGRTVHVAEAPAMPYQWDLTDTNGNPCPDGLYKASVLLHNDRDYGNSAPTPFVILKDK